MPAKERLYKWRRADYQENTRGLLIVNTGNGKGKTTCALGLMMRAAGQGLHCCMIQFMKSRNDRYGEHIAAERSEEHTSELQSQSNLVCRLLLEKKKYITIRAYKPT